MEITSQHWAIIINPKSGKKKFRQQRKYLFLTLKHAGIQFEYRVTRFAGHAVKIAQMFVENKYQNIMVLGGDGTISEVINGIFSANIESTQPLKIALIPRGTGNDWARFWGLTPNYKHSIDVFIKGNLQSIDIGKVNFELEGKKQTHYFINSVGFGLDAAVVNITHTLKRYLGSHSILYLISMLTAVFSYRPHKTTVSYDNNEQTMNMFTMNAANGCYSGGGMKQNPNAVPYDGMLDVMIARKPTFKDIITVLPLLFNGKILQHPAISSFRTDKLIVNSDLNALMEADGIVVYGTSPYEINIIPNAIQMIVP